MQPTRGNIAISMAGRDKGMLFAILSVEGEYCLLADGKLRPLERPKRKKQKHLQMTRMILPEQSLISNKQLRRSLARLKSEQQNGNNPA
ncbi:MAG: KOW domain-containing RNA-binding protein [Clostridia bacterium]|nr:KOW domain-containing RNA-binding protein [Clostridia bacterium]